MEQVTTVGIDLAKRVFALHAVDAMGRVVLRRTVRREQLMEVVAQLPPRVVGMEAGSGAHEWARGLRRLGHTPKLIAAKFVSPYRRKGKNDGHGAVRLRLRLPRLRAARSHARLLPGDVRADAQECLPV